MSYATRNKRNVLASVFAVIVIAAIAIWQFYQFATFKDVNGLVDMQGGSVHLWLAIAMSVFACITAFLVFSVFLRHDAEDELHITSPPRSRASGKSL